MRMAKRRQGGFTMVELVTVIVLIGALAAIGIPRLLGGDTIGPQVFGDQLTSALRLAQKTAVARRRLVCATLEGQTVALRIRQASGLPDAEQAACTLGIGVDDADYTGSGGSTVAGAGGFAGAGAIALYFHPDGTVTRDAAGSLPVGPGDEIRVVEGGAVRRTLRIEGSTGLVQ